MQKYLRRIVLAAALSVPLAAHAASETEIHLEETATQIMKPDRLRVTLRVEAKGDSAREVQAGLNRQMQAALDKAKSEKAVTSSTGAYYVYRAYNAEHEWQANQTLVLSSADFAALLTLAGALQAAGLAISGTEFYIAPETLKGAEAALTATALASLKARAGAVANDLGMAIDHYRTIEVGNAAPYGGPIRAMPMMSAVGMPRGASPTPPPVAEAADTPVSLSVSANIVLAPPK